MFANKEHVACGRYQYCARQFSSTMYNKVGPIQSNYLVTGIKQIQMTLAKNGLKE
jgi:hypothetical protein